MPIDMEQFKETFIDESNEGLDLMEAVLLEMQPGCTDSDAVNDIFRAAHSIKGGGATFGFDNIAKFTHVIETLLDQIRNGERELTQQAIDVFLKSVDCIRDMLEASQNNDDYDKAQVEAVKNELDRLLGVEQSADDTSTDASAVASEENISGWQIKFNPYPDMLRSGNDVVRMFQELQGLGSVACVVDVTKVPALVDMDAEESCLGWDLTLTGAVKKEQVEEVFEWVDDDCDLVITAIVQAVEVEKNEPVANVENDSTTEATQETNSDAGEARKGEDRRVKDIGNQSGPDRRKSADRRKGSTETASIRVGIDKIDALINMVGELVITQSMLGELGADFDMNKIERLKDGLVQLERNTRELQESVMRIRMLPISFAFNRFPRMVHDLCAKLDKKIELKMTGEQTELDKTVMEKIGDPLVHLVRNSIDHGIETPDVRKAAGKPETGIIELNAYHQGGNIIIEIKDDGAGLNRERIKAKAIESGLISEDEILTDEKIHDLLFQPGFSTAEVVTDVSGRGVGMDVVRRNIQSLGGTVEVKSETGIGSTFTIKLPLTLAILDGQLVRVGTNTYIIPLVSIVESILVDKANVNKIAGKVELYQLRKEHLPIIRLYEAFSIEPDNETLDNGLLVIVEGGGHKSGLLVDELLGQQQVVIKSLETNFRKVEGVSGATILGDGTVALIIDVASVVQIEKNSDQLQTKHEAAA